MNDGSILIVDDDYLDIMALKRAFKKLNINQPLHIAHNGKDALNKLRGDGEPKIDPFPSSIYLDINMPKMNGMEFLKILRSDPELKDLPVYILTTSNEAYDKTAAESLGISGYIVKPFFDL